MPGETKIKVGEMCPQSDGLGPRPSQGWPQHSTAHWPALHLASALGNVQASHGAGNSNSPGQARPGQGRAGQCGPLDFAAALWLVERPAQASPLGSSAPT